MNSLVNNVKVTNADSVNRSVKHNLNLACFEKHDDAPQTLVKDHVERKVVLTDPMSKMRYVLERGRLMDRSNYSVKIAKLT